MTGNVQFLENPEMPGNFPDWIELYNGSDVQIDLTGLFLSDDTGNLTKWKIPLGLRIPSKGFLLIYADNYPGLGINHAGFKLSSVQGLVLLVDRDGKTPIDSIGYDQQIGDVSWGRFPDGGSIFHFMEEPSPLKANIEGYSQVCEQASYSHLHGFYTEPFLLTFESSQPGSSIYYTLDGSSPDDTTAGSVLKYMDPININGTSVVRTMTFNSGCLISESLSQSYIYITDVLNQPAAPEGFSTDWGHTGEGDYEMDPEVVNSAAYKDDMSDALQSIPTLSLIMDHNDWFGPDGIYIEGELDKRKVSIEMFGNKDSLEFQINGAVMIVGGTSVNRWKSDKLSMRLHFDMEFGQGKLRFPVFNTGVESYNSLTIDARLNNAWHYGGKVNIRDRSESLKQNDIAQYTRDNFVAELQNQIGGYAPHGKKVHLYLNGIYWGMHWLHERPDEHFAAAYLGGSAEDYSILKHSYEEIESGTNQSYVEMLDLLDTDLYSPSSLDRIREYLDVENLIDYMILNITVGNSDWDHK
ncbi:MAG: CotH kinase family protein, partial [Bacteroidales bacterium]|nr:CotH kinase family protein [Bacteroidales bacterium]